MIIINCSLCGSDFVDSDFSEDYIIINTSSLVGQCYQQWMWENENEKRNSLVIN